MIHKHTKLILSTTFLFICLLGFSQKKVEWLSMKEALIRTQTQPKKIFVDVYTDWCGYCKKMDRSTFTDTLIINYTSDNFYAVKFNAEQKDSITLGNKTYKFVANGRRGYHQLAYELLGGRMAYPSIVFIDETGKLIERAPGYSRPPKFEAYLKFINGEHYKKTSFQEFVKTYKTPYPATAQKPVQVPGH